MAHSLNLDLWSVTKGTVQTLLVVQVDPDQERKFDFLKDFPGPPVVDYFGFIKCDESLRHSVIGGSAF